VLIQHCHWCRAIGVRSETPSTGFSKPIRHFFQVPRWCAWPVESAVRPF
jgi:hypothetical protein